MNAHTVMIGESVPLGPAAQPAIRSAGRLIVPFWPADPRLGLLTWPGESEVLMPGRWSPPIGPGVTYRRSSYLDQARTLPGTVDVLVVAAVRDADGWVLPWTSGTTGAVAAAGVDRVVVVEALGQTVVPGAPRIRADEIEVVGVAPSPLSPVRAEAVARPPSPEVERIGAALADLIPRGAWVELGIGALPSALLRHLPPDRVAGFVCGTADVNLLDSVTAWSASGWTVPVHTAMVFAPDRLVARAVEVQQLRLVPAEVSHCGSPELPFVAVNAALSVDLAGNVNTERVDGRVVSGRGGHPDFTRRGHVSTGGLSIVTLRSRNRNGVSNIVSSLPTPERSTDGALVDVIVTEHGIADLRGLDHEQRARAITAIAHPDDRSTLVTADPMAAGSSTAGS